MNLDIDFQPVKLEDKKTLDHYFKMRPRPLITYNFTSAYIWRIWDAYYWQIIDDALVLITKQDDMDYMLAPIADSEDKIIAATDAVLAAYHKAGLPIQFTEITDDLLAMYAKHYPGRIEAVDVPAGGNYIYEQQSLAKLEGKKFDAKRNHLHHFEKNHADWELIPMNGENAMECSELFVAWNEKLHPGDEELALEAVGVKEGLLHFDELQLTGAVLKSNGNIVAFTYGDELTPDTFCVHVEKADSDVRGAYQAINKFFVQEFCKEYTYINRAEDMGSEGLRKAKLSYHPCRIEKDYIMKVIE